MTGEVRVARSGPEMEVARRIAIDCRDSVCISCATRVPSAVVVVPRRDDSRDAAMAANDITCDQRERRRHVSAQKTNERLGQ